MKNNSISRRKWLKQTGVISIGLATSMTHLQAFAKKKKPLTILLVSGWQDVNIGDIAHTPGLLHIFQTFLPEATIILWKRSNGAEVKELLNRNFPKVKIIYGSVDDKKDVSNPEISDAFGKADIMVHGSGPSVVGQQNLEAWIKATDKPYGIFGTTIQTIDETLKPVLEKASFVYTRETSSLKVLEKEGIKGTHVAFAPDATFYLNIFNEKKASEFLTSSKLEPQKFICVIPRLRYTPYHQFSKVNWSQERIDMVTRVNAENKEKDHAKLREAMIAWVRETGNKILVCPEMTYQVDIMDELLIDPLPDDVKPFVVKRGYWLPDEAASIYAKAHTVLSFECHSPIMAASSGVPFFYLRQPEDTIKGQMYYDLGFNNWVFEIDQTEGKQITNRLREVWTNYGGAKTEIAKSMKDLDQLYKERTTYLQKVSS